MIRLLREQTYSRLHAASQAYSAVVQDRLSQASQSLRQIEHLLAANPYAVIDRQTARPFHNLTFITTDGLAIHLAGTKTASFTPYENVIKHALQEATPLFITTAGPDRRDMILIQPKTEHTASRGVFVALMNPEYLWEGTLAATLPETRLCILNERHIPLFCNQPDATSVSGLPAREYMLSLHGQLAWQKNDETYLAGYQKTLLAGAHAIKPYLATVAMQDESSVLAPLASYRTILWSSAGLSLLLTLLLGAIQIWRTLVPLRQMAEGIRRIEHNNFHTRLAIPRHDEFGELADCFNAMLGSLGNRFDSLTALSRIDQATLSASGASQVITNALLYLKRIPAIESASLSVFKPDAPEKISVYHLDPGHQTQLSSSTQILSHGIRTFLLSNPDGICATADSVRHLTRITPGNEATRYFFILPLKWKHHLIGFVSLGSSSIMAWSEEEITHTCLCRWPLNHEFCTFWMS